MNGAIPGSGSESLRQLSARFQAGALSGTSTQSGKSTHAGLFEQLLSMPPPARIQPNRSASSSSAIPSPTASTPNERDALENATNAGEVKKSQPDERASADEEDPASDGSEGQLALAQAIPTTADTAATVDTAEDSSPAGTAQAITEERVLPEQGDGDQPAAGEQSVMPLAESGQTSADEAASATEAAIAAEAQANSAARTRTAKTDLQSPATLSDNTAELAENARQLAENAADAAQPSDAEAELASEQNAIADELSAESQNAKRVAASATEADGHPHRGGNRAKWYERRPENAAATTAAAAREDATGNSAVSAAELAEAQPTETNTSEKQSLLQPLPTPAPAAAASVAMLSSAQAVVESVAASLAGGNLPTQPVGPAETVDNTTGPRNIELSGPTQKSSSHDAKAAAPETPRSDGLTQAERVRLVQRISRSFARLGPTGGAINIKLHPPQLGSLNVQVKMEGRTMTAKLSTESAAAREVILESLPVLRGRLAEQGFEIASFQVEVADNNADGANLNQQQSADHSSSGDRQFGRQVDYRRVAAMQRQQGEGITVSSPPAIPSGMAWQSLAHMDLQA